MAVFPFIDNMNMSAQCIEQQQFSVHLCCRTQI